MNIAKLKKVHQAQYFKLLAQNIVKLDDTSGATIIAEGIYKQIVDRTSELNIQQAMLFTSLPESYLQVQFGDIFNKSALQFGSKYRLQLLSIWKDTLDMGRRHQVEEILWQFPVFRPSLLKDESTRIAGFSTASLASSVLEQLDSSVAEFSPQDDRNIALAKRKQLELAANIDLLKAEGVYRRVDTSDKLVARMSINEKYRFLSNLDYIANYSRKAEAANKYFLGRNYLSNRASVLSTQYSFAQNNSVRSNVADYLKNDSTSLGNLRNKSQSVQTLIAKVEAKLKKPVLGKSLEPEKANAQAKTVIRTELALAYNFGKIAGFMAPEDREQEFKWNASFELEGKKIGYRVCTFCERQDGIIRTAGEIMAAGQSTDTDILNYDSKSNTTKWKDESNPQIVAHPNCSCFWELVPNRDMEELLPIAAAVPTPTPTVVTEESSLLPQVIAGGLLVAGGFLLSRSNAWKSFASIADDLPADVFDPIDNVIEVVNSVDEDVANTVRKVVSSIANS